MNENRLKVMFKMAMDWEKCTRSDVRLIFMSPDNRNSEIREQVNDSVATAVLRPWQNELFELLEGPVVPRKINWWFERTGNTGKTFMAKYLVLKFDAAVVQYMRKEDMLHMLCKKIKETTRVVVFDLVRTTANEDCLKVIYEVLEMVSDGVLSSGKYDSTQMAIQPVHVVVFANYPPETRTMSEDRWAVREIA